MNNWLIKQLEKIGLDLSNVKPSADTNIRILERGEKESIVFPMVSSVKSEWRILKWHFEKGQQVNYGDILCTIENTSLKEKMDFETYVAGTLNYFLREGQKVDQGVIVAEISGR
ncbi:biotin/lipoyl-containing protein [Robertkochia solimangrovi]|uniref:biotin/lipoyl-containing protein n=1 Tax=Robertkochia solimangrovi TaxID=2213046 RepID=UPI0011810465|nr:biotin/lipoyl-containing protein [Robertkochia solimangrovi]TRZ45106.1 hypothetical protein DMZ48_04970 [Robertkochia solimangrovi]